VASSYQLFMLFCLFFDLYIGFIFCVYRYLWCFYLLFVFLFSQKWLPQNIYKFFVKKEKRGKV